MVIGGGLAGAAAALALRERGRPVTVVERSAPGGGATGRSGGMLAPQYEAEGPTPLFRLCVRARGEWPGFARRVEALGARPVGLRSGGMLVRGSGAAEVATLRRAVEWQRSEGLTAELLGAEDARALQPGLGSADAWLWLPDEAWVDAAALGAAIEVALRRAEAALRTGIAAVAVRSTGGVVSGVELADGESLPAETVVVAAGAWSGQLRGLPRDLPVRPVRGQMIRYGAAAEVHAGATAEGGAGLGRLVADLEGHYLVPRQDGSLLAGSTMEDAGFEAAVTEEGLSTIARAARALLPRIAEAPVEESWAGLRPIASDGLPVLGPDPELPGLFWATGYGRNGILLAPLAGRLLADLVEGGAVGEVSFLAPERFVAGRPG